MLSVAAVSDSSVDMSTLRDVILPCLSLLVVIAVVFIVVCVCQRHRRQHDDAKSQPNRGRNCASGAKSGELPVEFPASSVRLVCDVCVDRGGRVYLGELASAPGHAGHRPVLVRTLASDADERSRAEFWRDADALAALLQHPHVAAVVGVTGRAIPGAPALLVECGPDLLSLRQYLVVAGSSLDHAARLRLAVHLASAMDYLSSRGVVHGDLAARNVAVTSASGPPVAKLSVGLSLGPALFPADYQPVCPDGPPLPVRWMSPEAIAAGGRTPTSAGDVWSYGVTLWEMYSAGCRPYEGFDDHELVELILTRRLLPCPPPPAQTAPATARVFALMVECWAPRPDDRPSFGAVLARLEQWRTAADDDDAAARGPASSGGTPSQSGGRPSPYPPVPARTCHAPDSSLQRPPAGPILSEGPRQSEDIDEGDWRSRSVSCATQHPAVTSEYRPRGDRQHATDAI